jgi:glyoxylase-like metal-dependent hydrolase (beta-lactamase superfamily II)
MNPQRGSRHCRGTCRTCALHALLLAAGAALLPGAAGAQQAPDFDKIEYAVTPVAAGIYMLSTPVGGNVGVSIGEDGVLVIDDQFAPLAPKLRSAVALLTDRPIRFLLNTHWHGDHTGANEAFARTGAVIVAQRRVRERLASPPPATLSGRTPAAAPAAALPVMTFDREVSLHLNGDDVEMTHASAAHTDGDGIVRFRRANVLHMGDTFFYGTYPFVDSNSGGTYAGLIAAVEETLATVNDSTRIIPGHGPLCGRKELQEFRDMLVVVRDRVARLIRAGRSQEEVIAAKPTAEFDAKWAGGFWKPEQWVARVYVDLKRTLPAQGKRP